MIKRADLKRYAHSVLARSGFEVRRVGTKRPDKPTPPFYEVSPSCQIPSLSGIYEFYLGRREHGMFIEVGAFDGFSFSNTSCLVSAGWSGHYAEPVPEFAKLCRERYATNPRVQVHEYAVGARSGTIEITVGGALSTPDKALLKEYKTVTWAEGSFTNSRSITVEQVTLTDLLEQKDVTPGFDVLVVDVEGYEAEVFEGFDLERWRPSMLIVELVDAHPDLESSRRAHAGLMRTILRHGYCVAFKDEINTLFVTDDVYFQTHGLSAAAE
jgi:FkbM family methyltransferase